MYQVKLEKSIYDYLMDMLKDTSIKKGLSSIEIDQDRVTLKLNVDTKLDLLEYVEDKQVEIGFVNEDYLNEDGKKLQIIYDEFYYQTN